MSEISTPKELAPMGRIYGVTMERSSVAARVNHIASPFLILLVMGQEEQSLPGQISRRTSFKAQGMSLKSILRAISSGKRILLILMSSSVMGPEALSLLSIIVPVTAAIMHRLLSIESIPWETIFGGSRAS